MQSNYTIPSRKTVSNKWQILILLVDFPLLHVEKEQKDKILIMFKKCSSKGFFFFKLNSTFIYLFIYLFILGCVGSSFL